MEDLNTSTSEQFYTTPTNNKKRSPKKLVWIIIVILLLGGGIFVIFSFFGESKTEEMAPAPVIITEEPTPTLELVETPTPEITSKITPTTSAKITPKPTDEITTTQKLSPTSSKLTIEILNGSGVSGAATKMKTFLTDKGYTVSSTGNAETFDYEKTTIRISAAKKNMQSQLEKDLSTDYVVEIGNPLPSTSSVDAQVIVGKE